ncbi:glucuronate isomerase [Vibrio sp. S9_S30]|uniref:glucuronate isomerase n=1 Tax=Vibrio sp. S9_S30 TaxID=2720226 RepID=UPI00168125C9|nr:glucuronate isomerase [Vibrio sp. S9_S30]MBD1556941.1 glucuronate isomerase [Vibrio sp. S9_S30]
MNTFLTEDFLLTNSIASELYHQYASDMPIYDYHCHLDPKDIAEDRQFNNLSQIWLEGDHYKWRAMRAAGVDEERITGKASDYDKFIAWASTVPKTLGNPLYHWTCLELRRPFGIVDTLLNEESADDIWQRCNNMLSTADFSARNILRKMNVRLVGTTDDPADSLIYHKQIAQDPTFEIDVLPTWRPDRVYLIGQPDFPDYLHTLGSTASTVIRNYEDLLRVLTIRLDHFESHGCRAADHGLDKLNFSPIPSIPDLNQIVVKRLSGRELSEQEDIAFSSAIQVWMGKEYHRRGWVMQLHIGALRNNNTRMYGLVGPNSGFDSIADAPIAQALARLLDELDKEDTLPKTILYCLNPRDNEVIATMTGNFQGGGIAGKIQFGSGWWFNDQLDGMQRQLQQLSQLGLLSQFIGMLTDSRSFLSYTRHEYFRRILCNMIGQWVARGEAPNDLPMLGKMIEDICFNNARNYFQQ